MIGNKRTGVLKVMSQREGFLIACTETIAEKY